MDLTITNVRKAWGFAEMSEATGLSVPFLRKEVTAGNLRATKFGRRVLVKDEEFQRYLDEGSGEQNQGEKR